MRHTKAATIVHITSVHRFTDTRICHRECAGLLRAGYEVILVAPVSPGERDAELPEGLRVVRVRPARTRFGRMLRVTIVVFWQAFRIRAELYHFHDPELMPFAVVLRMLGRRVIYDAHEDYGAEIATKEWLPKWVRLPAAHITSTVERLVSGMCSGVVAATPIIAGKFVNAKRRAVVCNYPSVEDLPVTVVKEFSKRRKAVIYVGDITAARGIYGILDALSKTRQECICVLGGRFNPRELLHQCEEHSSWTRIEFKGWLSRNRYAEELAKVWAGLLLFDNLPNHVTSLPNKLFEYMAAGIPIVASDFPLWRKLIGDAGCGLLVDQTDSQAVAETIDWLLTHPNEAQYMGGKGRLAFERQYNWRSQERELLGLYQQVLTDR